jgi:hypothetical protein
MKKADKIFVNGEVITVDAGNRVLEAIAVSGSRILDCGSNEEIEKLAGPDTEIIDLDGKCVLPGFIDSHVHFMQTGLNGLAINLWDARTVDDILNRIHSNISKYENDRVIRGIGYDEENLGERRPPNRWELDSICPDKPLWLCRIDSHSCVVNSNLLEQLDLEGVEGVSLDPLGRPDGILRGKANNKARNRVYDMIDDRTRRKAAFYAQDRAFEVGITTLNALEGGKLFHDNDFAVLHGMKEELKLDVEIFFQTTDVDKALTMGAKRVGGCIILDGSIGSRTAAIVDDYWDDPGNNGILYYTQQQIDEFVYRAHQAGLQVSVHAIGERAIDQILSAYSKALRDLPGRDHRHRIEHYELPTPEQIRLTAELGIIPSVQPAFDYYWGGVEGMYGIRLGKERALRMNPLKDILEGGCMILGGSDSDVTPMNPLLGIHAAVNHTNPQQRISVMEAIRAFTSNGAYGMFREREIGTIEKGKLADLVVLSENPLKVSSERIKDIAVHATFKKGIGVYTA